jgi:hypothetical protein
MATITKCPTCGSKVRVVWGDDITYCWTGGCDVCGTIVNVDREL